MDAGRRRDPLHTWHAYDTPEHPIIRTPAAIIKPNTRAHLAHIARAPDRKIADCANGV